MRKDVLDKRLETLQKMKDEKISSYKVIEIDIDGRSLEEMSTLVKGMVRPNDLVGVEDEEHLLLVAANCDDKGEEIVLKRLMGKGLNCRGKE